MEKRELFNIVIENVKQVLPFLENHEFKESDKLIELGANSVDRLEIVMLTLEALSLKIPLLETVGAKNIGELVELLHAKC